MCQSDKKYELVQNKESVVRYFAGPHYLKGSSQYFGSLHTFMIDANELLFIWNWHTSPYFTQNRQKLSWKYVNFDVTINIDGTGGSLSRKVRKV